MYNLQKNDYYTKLDLICYLKNNLLLTITSQKYLLFKNICYVCQFITIFSSLYEIYLEFRTSYYTSTSLDIITIKQLRIKDKEKMFKKHRGNILQLNFNTTF